MTQAKHTPAPWEIVLPLHPPTKKASLNVGVFAAVNGEQKIIAETFGQVSRSNYAPARANAERIVACVNLCKDLTNDEISKLTLEGLHFLVREGRNRNSSESNCNSNTAREIQRGSHGT